MLILFTILSRSGGQHRKQKTKSLDEVKVLLDQREGIGGRPCNVFLGHALVMTELDSPKILNIVFDFICTVE
jgi:hypothetical protein